MLMEISKGIIMENSVLSMSFVKNMIKKLHACPFVSRLFFSFARALAINANARGIGAAILRGGNRGSGV